MGRKYNDISGNKYGKLTVLDERVKSERGELLWVCECECGEKCNVTSSDLRRGRSNYCINCNNAKSYQSTLSCLVGGYRRGAEKRGLDFNLTATEFDKLITQNCHYCGVEPIQYYHKKNMVVGITYNGIDRIDNSVGYELDNCITACKFCNFAKSRWSLDEFLTWLNKIRGND